MQRAGARLPIDEYSRRLWHRRWFVAAYANASNSVGYEGSFLGQAWQLLTPLLNILVYYLIFGLLLHTNRGIPNYIAFLSVGVFVFSFCQNSLVSGARSITSNLGLVRALQFPRAVLPMSTTLVALHAAALFAGGHGADPADQRRAGDVALAGTRAGDRRCRRCSASAWRSSSRASARGSRTRRRSCPSYPGCGCTCPA